MFKMSRLKDRTSVTSRAKRDMVRFVRVAKVGTVWGEREREWRRRDTETTCDTPPLSTDHTYTITTSL